MNHNERATTGPVVDFAPSLRPGASLSYAKRVRGEARVKLITLTTRKLET
mgnify:CR=1 FL=1